jgi:hypothetical protein
MSDNAFHIVLSGNVRDTHAIPDRRTPDRVLAISRCRRWTAPACSRRWRATTDTATSRWW